MYDILISTMKKFSENKSILWWLQPYCTHAPENYLFIVVKTIHIFTVMGTFNPEVYKNMAERLIKIEKFVAFFVVYATAGGGKHQVTRYYLH